MSDTRNDTPRDCEHGQQARTCRVCELETDNQAQRIAIGGLHGDILKLERELAAREAELADALGRAYRAEVAIGPLAASIVSAQQRAEKAEAERDAAVKDAERYRWLMGDPDSGPSARFNKVYRKWNGNDGQDGFTAALDAAIDAAKGER